MSESDPSDSAFNLVVHNNKVVPSRFKRVFFCFANTIVRN